MIIHLISFLFINGIYCLNKNDDIKKIYAIYEGESVIIPCNLGGDFIQSYSLQLNGKNLLKNQNSINYKIFHARLEDSGIYTCLSEASNKKSEVILEVKNKPYIKDGKKNIKEIIESNDAGKNIHCEAENLGNITEYHIEWKLEDKIFDYNSSKNYFSRKEIKFDKIYSCNLIVYNQTMYIKRFIFTKSIETHPIYISSLELLNSSLKIILRYKIISFKNFSRRFILSCTLGPEKVFTFSQHFLLTYNTSLYLPYNGVYDCWIEPSQSIKIIPKIKLRLYKENYPINPELVRFNPNKRFISLKINSDFTVEGFVKLAIENSKSGDIIYTDISLKKKIIHKGSKYFESETQYNIYFVHYENNSKRLSSEIIVYFENKELDAPANIELVNLSENLVSLRWPKNNDYGVEIYKVRYLLCIGPEYVKFGENESYCQKYYISIENCYHDPFIIINLPKLLPCVSYNLVIAQKSWDSNFFSPNSLPFHFKSQGFPIYNFRKVATPYSSYPSLIKFHWELDTSINKILHDLIVIVYTQEDLLRLHTDGKKNEALIYHNALKDRITQIKLRIEMQFEDLPSIHKFSCIKNFYI